MRYRHLTAAAAAAVLALGVAAAPASAGTTSTEAGPEVSCGLYRVTSKTGLNLRSGPGTQYRIIGGLAYGELSVFEDRTVNGFRPWPATSSTWASAKYLQKTKTVNCPG